MLLEQVFDLTEKSLNCLIGWTGKVSCNKLQEIEQCSKLKDSCNTTFESCRRQSCCKPVHAGRFVAATKIAATNCLVCPSLKTQFYHTCTQGSSETAEQDLLGISVSNGNHDENDNNSATDDDDDDDDDDDGGDRRWLETSWCMLDMPTAEQQLFTDLKTPEQVRMGYIFWRLSRENDMVGVWW